MRLRTYQANDGDCLLLSSDDNRHMLIDGGRSGSFKAHVAKSISETEISDLDLVCVSHIDADHITGILTMLEAEIDWRIHLHEKQNPPQSRTAKAKPKAPKPARIHEIWHNGFGDQLGDTAGEVSSMLSLAAKAQLSLNNPDIMPRQNYLPDLALGEKQAIELSHRIGASQLNIPLNQHFGGKLILADAGFGSYMLGTTRVDVVGPFKSDLAKLRHEWKEWVEKNKTAISALQIEMEADANRLGSVESETFLRNANRIQSSAGQFGDEDSVSKPNLASIMLYAEENQRSVVLTGDGSSADVEAGLKKLGKLDADGRCHVNVFKIPHHGAAANVGKDFFKNIIADHYVFCGNGSHTNPEVKVVKLIAESRMGSAQKRSKHPNAGKKFQMHFNCTSAIAGTAKRSKHMHDLEKEVAALVSKSSGQMDGKFYSDSFFDIRI